VRLQERYAVAQAMHFVEAPGIFKSRDFVIDRHERHALMWYVKWRSDERNGCR
jgi:hypothetical protein